MSPRFFPTASNAVSGNRRAFFFQQIRLGILLAVVWGSQHLLCAQGQPARPVMPPWQACERVVTIRRWAQGNNLIVNLVRQPDQCPANTVFKYEPAAGQPVRSSVTLYISTGPQIPPTGPPVTPNPAITVTPRPTAILVTPVPPTPVPPTPTETPTLTPTETLTPTPTETPTPSPTTTPSETPTSTSTPPPFPTSSPFPCPTDDPNCDTNKDWPWGWILLGFVLPISGIGGGQALRYLIWKKRISVEASADGPYLEWIGPLNPPDDAIEARVNVFPGNVVFDGPIQITKREEGK